MLVKVKMPKIGLTTEQVEVTEWLKNVGDTIERDETETSITDNEKKKILRKAR